MPKYCYQCKNCEHQFEIRHSMRDRLYDCPECELAESLARIPQLIQRQIKKQENKKTGQLVKEYIEKNREVLKEQKREVLTEKYEP